MKHWWISLIVVLALGALSLGVFSLAENSVPERSSPSDWLREDQIQVYSDKVILDVSNAAWFHFTDTNSMDPFLDENSNAIVIQPSSPDVIAIGDVITYRSIVGTIIHRVIEKGEDAEGPYFLVKGDNNTVRDPIKVRFEDIEGVVVAVIY